jgi:hypothetical protein
MDPWTLVERELLVRGGLSVVAAERLTRIRPCGHSGGWELTESCGKRERSSVGSSPRVARGGGLPEVSRQQWGTNGRQQSSMGGQYGRGWSKLMQGMGR